jgi:MFS family permease
VLAQRGPADAELTAQLALGGQLPAVSRGADHDLAQTCEHFLVRFRHRTPFSSPYAPTVDNNGGISAEHSARHRQFGGMLFVMTYTLQEGLHESAEQAGLTFVPLGAAFAVASLAGARLGARMRPRLITVGAFTSSAACALLLVQANGSGIAAGPGHLWPFMALLGAGNGLAIPAMIAWVLRVVARATCWTLAD